MYQVEIIERPALRLAALAHRGNYSEIGAVFNRLGGILGERGLWPKVQGMVGVYYDNPDSTAESDLRSHAGAVVAEETEISAPLEAVSLEGGRYAVLHHTGPYDTLKDIYAYLYGDWLAGSGETPADAPPYEHYLNSPQDTAPAELKTDVCMRLR